MIVIYLEHVPTRTNLPLQMKQWHSNLQRSKLQVLALTLHTTGFILSSATLKWV
jgi:hypothetical protein